jgi:hypothetical protein
MTMKSTGIAFKNLQHFEGCDQYACRYLDGLHVKGGGEVVWSRVPPGGETVVSGEYVHPLPHPASLALPLLPHFCGPLFHCLKRSSEREQMDYKCIQI